MQADNSKKQNEKPPSKKKGLLFGLLKSKKRKHENLLAKQQPEEIASLQQEDEPLEKEKQSSKKDENIVKVKNNSLYELYCRHLGLAHPSEEQATFPLSVFAMAGQTISREQRVWLKDMEKEAHSRLQNAKNEEEKALDAQVRLFIQPDRMGAWGFVMPKMFSGQPPNMEGVKQLVAKSKITFGVDQQALESLLEEDNIFRFVQIAKGVPAVDGKDGQVVDHFRRDSEIQLTVKDDNTIDYKDLNWLQTVVAGDVICDIILPGEPQPGTNVLGAVIKGRPGRKAVVPNGNGTRVSAEGTALLADIDGALSFASNRFRVDPLLVIKGDVDTAVGNLNAVGDILIHGDILEGFTVTATRNITVQGMVEGAQVVAGGNIQVGRGMNGNSHGVMRAKGDVRSKFIENGTVTAGGKIICDTIINSTISSDETIEVKTGRGAIIGGNITALIRIDALSIGNQSNRSMVVTLGSTSNYLREKYELEQKRKEVAQDIDEINKNIAFLKVGKQNTQPKMSKTLDDLKLKLTVQKMQLANLDRKITIMSRRQMDITKCRMRAEVIYPPVQIFMGSFTKILRETSYNALVYYKEGEIHVANV